MKKYYSHSILLLEGFILGFFEMIPFLRIDFVRTLFHIKLNLKDDFQKVIKRDWSYYLGVFLGIIFFFAIPLSFMMDNYSGTIYYVFLPIIIINIISSVILMVIKKKTSLRNIIFSLLFYTLFALLSYLVNYSLLYDINSFDKYILISLMIALFTFLAVSSNMSISTFLSMSLLYYPLYKAINPFALFQNIKEPLPLVFFILLGLFIGCFSNYILAFRFSFFKDDIGCIPVLIISLIYDINRIKGKSPISTANRSQIAMTMVFVTSLIAVICIALLLAINSIVVTYRKEKLTLNITD